MPSNKRKNLFLFICLIFLLPKIITDLAVFFSLVWGYFFGVANLYILFAICGIAAASPAIAAIVMIFKDESFGYSIEDDFEIENKISTLVIPFAIACVAIILTKTIACSLPEIDFDADSFPPFMCTIILLSLIANEIGWRGYLHPLLCLRMKCQYLVPFVVGTILFIWHYYYFCFFCSFFDYTSMRFIWFYIICIVESYICGSLLKLSDDNMFSTVMYRFSYNLFGYLFDIQIIFLRDDSAPRIYSILIALEIVICLVLAFIVRKKKVRTDVLEDASEFPRPGEQNRLSDTTVAVDDLENVLAKEESKYREIENTEKWQEVFIGKIPQGVYQVQLINGEKQGLTIEISSGQTCVVIKFGVVQAVRMLDEGIVQSNLCCDSEIKKYKDDNFQNVIYEVQEGEFGKQINSISDGYGECLNLRHYVVITQNYNIDVITEWEPTIEISQK